MICPMSTSSGSPFFSYIARKNIGSMMMIIPSAASELLPVFRMRKYAGMPMTAATAKHMSCLFVSPKRIFVLTRDRSLGTEI